MFAAGTYGTQPLLHRMKDDGRAAAALDRLGDADPHQLRGDRRRAAKYAVDPRRSTSPTGVAITSSFHPDADTHIEPVRYGKGSNAMGCCRRC